MRADRGVQAGEGARLRPAHPSAVNAEEHFKRRVPEHRRDVLRRVALFEREACERVPALVDDSRPHLGFAQDPRPVASAKVGEVNRRTRFGWKTNSPRSCDRARCSVSSVRTVLLMSTSRSEPCVFGSPKPKRRCTVRLMRIRPCSKSMEFQASASASLGRMPVNISTVRKARSQPCAASMIRSASPRSNGSTSDLGSRRFATYASDHPRSACAGARSRRWCATVQSPC